MAGGGREAAKILENLKYEKDSKCHCWFEDSRGNMTRDAGSLKKLTRLPAGRQHENGHLSLIASKS